MPRKASTQDGCNIGVIVPRFYDDGTNGVKDNDGVGALLSGGKDKVLSTVPKGKVL